MAEKTLVEMYWETSEIAHNAIDKLKEMTSGVNRVLVAGVGNLLLDNDAEVRRLTRRAADVARSANVEVESH